MDFIYSVLQKFKDPLHKNAIYLLINSIGSSGLGFIFWIIVGRYYSSEEVGIASALISSMILLALLGNLGFGWGMIRFLPEKNKTETNNIISSCLTISGSFTLLLALLFIIGLQFFSPVLIFIRDNILYMFMFFLFVYVWVITNLLNAIFTSKRATKFVFFKDTIIFSSLKLFIPFFLLPLGAYGIFTAWGIAAFTAFLVTIIIFIRKIIPTYRISFTVEKKSVSPLFYFSIGNHFGEIFRLLPGLILPLIILNLLTASDTGYFYIDWMIASLLFMIPTAVSTSLLTEGSIERQLFKNNFKKAIKLILLLLLPAIFTILLFADILLLLIGSEYSDNASFLLQILALSSIPFTINIIFITMKRVEKKIREIVIIYGLMAISIILISIYFIQDVGLIGAGYAWLIGQIIGSIMVSGALIINRRSRKTGND